jgi:phosphocarrier protein FPr
MVGIVLVSHSATLADGAVELARQMGGEELSIEPAGGLDLPGRPVGTDAVVVMNAIDRAWSEDGVLVLMDLGSAVLSAQMAVEMIEEDRRDRVRLSSAPFVEGAVAAAVAARLGRPLEQVAAEARGGLEAKADQVGDAPTETRDAGDAAPDGTARRANGSEPDATAMTIRIVVPNRLGLHARPAARFVTTASQHGARVTVRDLTNGRGPADARSLNAVATLGVSQGHELEVTARGDGAAETLDAIGALAAANFGDADDAAETPSAVDVAPVAAGDGSLLTGAPASPGLAVGPVRHLVRQAGAAFGAAAGPDRPTDGAGAAADGAPSAAGVGPVAGTPDEERARFDRAVETVAAQIRATRASVAARAGESAAEIFDAHLLVLTDEEMLRPVRDAIARGRPAAEAWRSAIRTTADRWRALEDPYLRSRAEDVEAVGDQVAEALGDGGGALRVSGAGVLVTADLTPAQTAALDAELVTGIATARGGPTSHVAVLARSLGLPAVVALGERILEVTEGTEVLVDGGVGTVRLEPDQDQRADAELRAAAFRDSERRARTASAEPAMTRDAIRIEVMANVGRPGDAPAATEAGADGVGLLRTEFLFLDRGTMPSEDEQVAAYRAVADALEGSPVILRTLDVGGDKPLPYVAMHAEANPFLGVRGLRLGLERPELLRTQLRAAARAAVDRPIRVMFPMVTTIDDVRRARAMVDEVLDELGDAAPTRFAIGAMVEVPAAALEADVLAKELDFFSIGTNDLAQYTLAAERGNDGVAELSDALHPAVLRLIRSTVDGAQPRALPVAVCGELASDATAVPILLGLGVRELSVAPPAVPRIKAAVREVSLADARTLAERALACADAGEVRALAAGTGEGIASDEHGR